MENPNKHRYIIPGSKGLPEHYPVPRNEDDLLFYIQRNHNRNTIAYKLNKMDNGDVDSEHPMLPYWINYDEGGQKLELNYIQNKFAYGYNSNMVSPGQFEFTFVAYAKMKFHIGTTPQDDYAVFCHINNKLSRLNNIYVYVEDFGVFPDPRFIELYGEDVASGLYNYQKIPVEL